MPHEQLLEALGLITLKTKEPMENKTNERRGWFADSEPTVRRSSLVGPSYYLTDSLHAQKLLVSLSHFSLRNGVLSWNRWSRGRRARGRRLKETTISTEVN